MPEEPSTPPATEAPPETGPPANDNQQQASAEKDWKAEYEKTLAESRKWEDRAKKALPAVKELDELKKSGMTDLEKATAAAREEGAAEARKSYGARLVDAEVRAAAAGRNKDVIDALLDGLDRHRFLTDDGEPDSKAIAKWVERAAPAQPQTPPPLDLGQGARPGTETAPDMNDRIRQRLRT